MTNLFSPIDCKNRYITVSEKLLLIDISKFGKNIKFIISIYIYLRIKLNMKNTISISARKISNDINISHSKVNECLNIIRTNPNIFSDISVQINPYKATIITYQKKIYDSFIKIDLNLFNKILKESSYTISVFCLIYLCIHIASCKSKGDRRVICFTAEKLGTFLHISLQKIYQTLNQLYLKQFICKVSKRGRNNGQFISIKNNISENALPIDINYKYGIVFNINNIFDTNNKSSNKIQVIKSIPDKIINSKISNTVNNISNEYIKNNPVLRCSKKEEIEECNKENDIKIKQNESEIDDIDLDDLFDDVDLFSTKENNINIDNDLVIDNNYTIHTEIDTQAQMINNQIKEEELKLKELYDIWKISKFTLIDYNKIYEEDTSKYYYAVYYFEKWSYKIEDKKRIPFQYYNVFIQVGSEIFNIDNYIEYLRANTKYYVGNKNDWKKKFIENTDKKALDSDITKKCLIDYHLNNFVKIKEGILQRIKQLESTLSYISSKNISNLSIDKQEESDIDIILKFKSQYPETFNRIAMNTDRLIKEQIKNGLYIDEKKSIEILADNIKNRSKNYVRNKSI